MFPPFAEEEAAFECRRIIRQLDSGELTLTATGQESTERSGQGIMIGALVCSTADGQKKVLRTVSGIRRVLNCENFVPPIVPSEQIDAALQKNDKKIHELTEEINRLKKTRLLSQEKTRLEPTAQEKALCAQRSALTTESLKAVLNLYSFCCADGATVPLKSLIQNKLPPTGTGDCCAVKLLDYAFKNKLTPLSMAEVFYGKSTSLKQNGIAYPPCDERCGLVLPKMLGLNILYRDEHIIVVNKQSGLLSVPGRTPEKQDCIVSRVRRLFPNCIAQPSVHRLDMETSGLMVLAFTEQSHRDLCRQFEQGNVQKEYVALLDGKSNFPSHGQMELYFRVDIENRPHQIWDSVYGKKAVTEWQFERQQKYVAPNGKTRIATRVRFFPHTGRTHQLRLASADSHGFGVPIIGDTLYGKCETGERLMLHAERLSFVHPVTLEKMNFTCSAPF